MSVLNMPEFRIFVNFRKYDRILNVCRDAIAIMEKFLPELRIWQGCEYARVTQGAEYA